MGVVAQEAQETTMVRVTQEATMVQVAQEATMVPVVQESPEETILTAITVFKRL
jgi:hypothetical protein